MNVTRKQHYVWQKYLRAWATDEQIWCRRLDKIFSSNIKGVGAERDFYRIKEMTLEDIEYVRNFCMGQPPALREANLFWLEMFNRLYDFKRLLIEMGEDPESVEKQIETLSIELEEKEVHGKIEAVGEPYLDALLREDPSFYRNVPDRYKFIHFICVQFTRTKKPKVKAASGPGRMVTHDPERIWNVMSHIVAYSLGATMCGNHYELFLLKNNTSVSLITGDQPVINIHSSDLGPMDMAEELDFYYPISPRLAVLVARVAPDDSEMTVEDVNNYNSHIARQAHEQLYAASREHLLDFTTVIHS